MTKYTDREEPNASALHTGAEGQGTGDVRFSRSGIADQDHVLVMVHVFTGHQLPNQGLVDRGLSCTLLAIDQLTLDQTQQIRRDAHAAATEAYSRRMVGSLSCFR